MRPTRTDSGAELTSGSLRAFPAPPPPPPKLPEEDPPPPPNPPEDDPPPKLAPVP
ncbi:MAG: DUF2497 domain-containing protein, partial [Verrucomicrobiaceae bacterium]